MSSQKEQKRFRKKEKVGLVHVAQTVWCHPPDSPVHGPTERAALGKKKTLSAIIHRTVWCPPEVESTPSSDL
jgi:hypothetical protein